MWNRLILTAGSEQQKLIFGEQLVAIPTDVFCDSIEAVTDESPGIRIGSGGATLSIVRRAIQNFDEKTLEKQKTLLVHSGGLSQRMPHLSAYGKAFGMLPNAKSILETKLQIYQKHLLERLPTSGGIMISASDVIENMEECEGFSADSDVDVLVFAHISSLEVGTQHGVFVMDSESGTLKRVLQKPSVEEMEREGAVRPDGKVLTDSCFFMTWQFCRRLTENPILREPVTEELCCYGDFMRPMGTDPKLDYIEKSASPQLSAYREALAKIFKEARVKISILGENSFFHFGTYREFVEHLLPKSSFRTSFPRIFQSNVIHSAGFQKVPDSSFVEFSTGNQLKIGDNCILSGIEADANMRIPPNTVVFTMALEKGKFVSLIFKIEDDLKRRWARVRWNQHDTRIEDASLWETPIFGVWGSRAESLKATLDEWENGIKNEEMGERLSIGEAVKRHDLETDLEWRRRRFTCL